MIRPATFAALAAVALFATPAAAAVELDQYNIPEAGAGWPFDAKFFPDPGESFGQTVTVGKGGTLAYFDIALLFWLKPKPYDLDIYINNQLAAAFLAGPVTGAADWSTITRVDLTGLGLVVKPGDRLLFNFQGDMGVVVGGDYARGAASSNGWQWNYDYAFRTYVDVASAVPEPGAWALMTIGFAMAGGLVRRERRLSRTARS